MAEGGNVSLREDRLRKTTLDMRKERQLLEQEKEEEIMRRIQERNRNEEVLADFRNQREELIKSRMREKENSQELSYTMPRKETDTLSKRRLTDGDIGTKRLESLDLSLETLRLDEKLTHLENSVLSDRNTLHDSIKEHTDRRDSRMAHENIIDRLSTIMDREDIDTTERSRMKKKEDEEKEVGIEGYLVGKNEKEFTDNSLFSRDDRYPIERNRRKEIESRERIVTDGGSQRNELEESIRVLEDVELKEKNTIFDDRQHMIDMKQKQFEKWTTVLEEKEIEIQRKSNDLVKREILFEKELKEKSLQFKIQEDRLIELQKKIEQKYENFERTMRIREERLNIDVEQTYRKREILIEEEFKKKMEEIEERINENWRRKFQEREIVLEELSRRLREKEEMEHGDYRRYLERNEREHQQFIHEQPEYTHSLYATDFKHTTRHHDRKPFTEEENLAFHHSSDKSRNIEFSETAREIRDNMGVKLNMTPFSGKEPVPRNEASFEEFKLEFDTVRNIYSGPVLKQGLRKSLRDQAKKVMLHLGASSTVDQIMKSLEETFGNIASEDSLLSKFLLAEQMPEETIVEWSLRLEELILQVERKSLLHSEERKALLKKRFWRGLKNEELKQATRVHFESPMTYEELRNKIRAEEYEIQLQKERSNVKTKTGKSYQTTTELHESKTPELNTIMETIQNMNKKLEELTLSQQQLQQHQTESTQSQRGRGYARGNRGRGSSSTRGYNRNRLEDNMDAPSNGDLN